MRYCETTQKWFKKKGLYCRLDMGLMDKLERCQSGQMAPTRNRLGIMSHAGSNPALSAIWDHCSLFANSENGKFKVYSSFRPFNLKFASTKFRNSRFSSIVEPLNVSCACVAMCIRFTSFLENRSSVRS